MAEIIDIVDEDDHVIGQRERGEAHAQNLIHRAAHVFVFNSKGELLLQKRSMKKKQYAGFWGDVAGHMGAGEDYKSAAEREMEEEIGVKCKLDFMMKLRKRYEKDQEFIEIYKCVCDGPFKNDPEEVEFTKFFSLAEVKKMFDRGENFTPGTKIALENYFNIGKQ